MKVCHDINRTEYTTKYTHCFYIILLGDIIELIDLFSLVLTPTTPVTVSSYQENMIYKQVRETRKLSLWKDSGDCTHRTEYFIDVTKYSVGRAIDYDPLEFRQFRRIVQTRWFVSLTESNDFFISWKNYVKTIEISQLPGNNESMAYLEQGMLPSCRKFKGDGNGVVWKYLAIYIWSHLKLKPKKLIKIFLIISDFLF